MSLLIGSHYYITTKQTLSRIPFFSKDMDKAESGLIVLNDMSWTSCQGTLSAGYNQPVSMQPMNPFSFNHGQPSNEHAAKPSKTIFIDRDGYLFEYILSFVRSNGSVHSLPSMHDLATRKGSNENYNGEGHTLNSFGDGDHSTSINFSSSLEFSHKILIHRLREEALFYGLDLLVEKCNDILANVSEDVRKIGLGFGPPLNLHRRFFAWIRSRHACPPSRPHGGDSDGDHLWTPAPWLATSNHDWQPARRFQTLNRRERFCRP